MVAAAAALLREQLDGRPPDVLIACDCIFQPIFGSAFLLLQMVQALAAAHTVVLLALERRDGDGADEFFAQAARAGFETTLRVRRHRVLVCEMRRSAGAAAQAESGSEGT